MKNVTIFLVLFIITNSLGAQLYNSGSHMGRERMHNMVSIGDNFFYIKGTFQIPGCCEDSIFLVGKNTNGQEIFKTFIAVESFMYYCKVVVTPDKHLLVYAGTQITHCDYGNDYFEVSKIDTTGTIVWRRSLSVFVLDLIPLADSTFIIVSGGSCMRYNTAGIHFLTYAHGITSFQSATSLSNGNFLLSYSSSSGARLRELNPSGNLVSDVPAPSVFKKMEQHGNGKIIGISGNYLQIFSNNYSLQYHSSTSLPANYVVNAFTFRKDTIFAAVTTGTMSPRYLVLDSTLSVLLDSPSNMQHMICTGLAVNGNNKVAFVMNSNISLNQNWDYTAFFLCPLNGSLIAEYDIGVVDLNIIDSVTSFGNFKDVHFRVDVTVRNFGVDTVKSFVLNHYNIYGGIALCARGLNKFYNVSIPPGGTVIVNTGKYNPYRIDSEDINADGTINKTFCIYSSVPNYKNDYNYFNNKLCKDISIKTVGIKEGVLGNEILKVFPNPTNDYINISNDFQISNVEVFDLTGRSAKVIDVNNNSLKIDVQDFQSGLYVFKINSESGTAVRKVMVQR